MVVCGCVEYLMRLEVTSGVVGGSVVGRSVVIGLPVVVIYLAVVLGSRDVFAVLSFSLFMILRFGSFE
jgi:hypothetical protein